MKKYDHKTPLRSGVVLVNLGTPEDTSVGAIRRWLARFLRDRRVIEIPRWLWWPILHGIILRLRPQRLTSKYSGILIDGLLPLRAYTESLSKSLERALTTDNFTDGDSAAPVVRFAMTYGDPGLGQVIEEMGAQGVVRFLILPMYPQYSATTTAPIFDQCMEYFRGCRYVPEIHLVHSYHNRPAYIDALARSVQAHWDEHGRGEHLLMSFHGLPVRNIREGDPYLCQSHATARLLRLRLGLDETECSMSFQSRFGMQKWLMPPTDKSIVRLARSGTKTLDVVCPGFACDCLETLDEIGIEAASDFKRNGGLSLRLIPCLNSGENAVSVYADLVEMHRPWLVGEASDASVMEQRQSAYSQSRRAQGLAEKGE